MFASHNLNSLCDRFLYVMETVIKRLTNIIGINHATLKKSAPKGAILDEAGGGVNGQMHLTARLRPVVGHGFLVSA